MPERNWKRTGKEQGGEARFIENVSSNLIYGEFVCPASAGHFLCKYMVVGVKCF